MKISAFNDLQKLDNEGTEVPYNGMTLIIAPIGNEKYDRELRRLIDKYRNEHDSSSGEIPSAQMEEIIREVHASCILLGWSGLTEDDEKTPIPYSKELAAKLIRENYRFYKDVMVIATKLQARALSTARAEEGNLLSTSLGS